MTDTCDGFPEIFVGNFTLFRFHVVDQDGADVDLQGLSGSDLEIVFNRPISPPVVVIGVLSPTTDPLLGDGEDGRYEYQVTSPTFLNEAGLWKRQSHVTFPGGIEFRGTITDFTVLEPLPVI